MLSICLKCPFSLQSSSLSQTRSDSSVRSICGFCYLSFRVVSTARFLGHCWVSTWLMSLFPSRFEVLWKDGLYLFFAHFCIPGHGTYKVLSKCLLNEVKWEFKFHLWIQLFYYSIDTIFCNIVIPFSKSSNTQKTQIHVKRLLNLNSWKQGFGSYIITYLAKY